MRTNAASIPDFDRFWADGYFEIPKGADEYLMFEKFRADPAANKLTTPSGKIELYSEKIAGFGYDHAATEDAWSRVFSFFGEHLR